MPLRLLSEVPEGLLEWHAEELQDTLGGPALIQLAGAREPSLFVSVLLHGNETSGWDGLRRYLADHPKLSRSMTIFIGNVAAAAQGVRVLPDQQDFNRIWRGATGAGGALAQAVRSAIADRALFAAVDLHNNTGHNPYYAVITDLQPENLGLAYLFSDKAVYVREPDTVLTREFTGRCPSITLEVGPVGDARCEERVYDYLNRVMELDAVPTAMPAEFSLFRALGRVHVRRGVGFSFAGDELDTPLVLTGGVEAINFHELAAGSRFGSTSLRIDAVLNVLDVDQRDVTAEFFEIDGDEILLKRSVVPAMYTTDPFVVRQDCLCYFMDRMDASSV